MMKLFLKRYFGGKTVTKSFLEVWVGGKLVLEFEARELAYRHYTKKFAGSTHFCIPCGTFSMKPRCTKFGLMSLRTQRMPFHSDITIGWSMFGEAEANAIIIGQSDGDPDPMLRGLVKSQQAFELLTHYVYDTFGQDVTLTVTNEDILTEDEYWSQMTENEEISMEK